MKNILNGRADMYVLIVCFIFSIAAPIIGMGENLGKETGANLDMNLMLSGVLATIIAFGLYYLVEALYSLLLYRLNNELAMFGIGLMIIVGVLTYLTRFLFVGTPFDRMITNLNQLNEGLANITVIVSVVVVLTVLSVLYGHTLGESIYRVAFMYVSSVAGIMVFFYYNPMNLDGQTLLLALNVFIIYFTLRQLARCKGLVVLNQHNYYNSK